MAFPLGAVLEAGGSIVSGLVGGLFSANQARKNRAFQERMYNKQVEDNINFWQMQNDYNLPSAQMQRLKDAGLNPLMMYGDGGMQNVATGAPQSGSLPSGSQASYQFQNPFDGFGLMDSQRKVLEAQVENLGTQSEKNLAEALLASENVVKSREESDKIRSEAEFNWRSMKDRLAQVHAENVLKSVLKDTEIAKQNEIAANCRQIEHNIDWIDMQVYNSERLTDQQVKKMQQDIENSIKITASTIAKNNAEARKALADAWYAKEQARLVRDTHDAVVDKYLADMRNAIASADEQELETLMKSYAWDKMPAPGSGTWKYQKFLENYVTPITSSIGAILGGAVAGTGAAMVRKGK